MPPPRSLRVLEPLNDEPSSADVVDAMHAYASAHQVDELLQLLLKELLEAQPLDPFDFMITLLAQKHPQLDALEHSARIKRFDLRREKTKKALVVAFYRRLLALQRSQHGDRAEALAPELSRAFLITQLRLPETKTHLQEHFPKHHRDLIRWFVENEKRLPNQLTVDEFTSHCMAVLATMAAA